MFKKPNQKIELKGERVVLSSFVNSDFKLIRKWFNNDEAMKHFMILNNKMHFFLKMLIKFFKPLILTKLFKYFLEIGSVFIINYNDEQIGFVIFWMIDDKEKVYRIPIAIGNPDYWGKGLGKDTIRTASRYIFNDFNGQAIVAGDVSKENARSKNMFLSCGFQELPTSQAEYFRNLSIPEKAKKRSSVSNKRDDTISLILRNENAKQS